MKLFTTKKKICSNCQYCRKPGALDFNIPGSGTWCSNSQSPLYRTRIAEAETCQEFVLRGKKAPLAMRVAIKGMDVVNHRLPGILNKPAARTMLRLLQIRSHKSKS